jgi:hypothetical protein
MQVRPIAGAVTNTQIDPIGGEIYMTPRRANPQIDLRMAFGEITEAGYQPFVGKIGRHGHRQHIILLRAGHRFTTGLQALQRFAHERQIESSGTGQGQTPGLALEKGYAHDLLQFAHLMANRTLGQV